MITNRGGRLGAPTGTGCTGYKRLYLSPLRPARALLSSGHGDRVGRSDHNGRRAGAPRRRVPPRRARAASGAPHLRPVRQGPGVPGRLRRPVAAHGRRAPRRRARVEQPVPELGDRRPGEVGPRRVRLRAGGLPRRGPLPRLPRPVLPARGPRPLRVRRVGRGPAVEQRQGRHQRHLLLRDERLARRRACSRRTWPRSASGRAPRTSTATPPTTAASCPRSSATGTTSRSPWSSTGSATAARAARSPGSRWPARRPVTEAELESRPGGVRRADRRAPARRRVLPRPLRALGPDHRAAADRRQLGRPGPAHPGQLRGLHPRRVGAQVAGGARPGALDALLHRLRRRPAETVLRLLPAR